MVLQLYQLHFTLHAWMWQKLTLVVPVFPTRSPSLSHFLNYFSIRDSQIAAYYSVLWSVLVFLCEIYFLTIYLVEFDRRRNLHDWVLIAKFQQPLFSCIANCFLLVGRSLIFFMNVSASMHYETNTIKKKLNLSKLYFNINIFLYIK